jgi:hypothetical protein
MDGASLRLEPAGPPVADGTSRTIDGEERIYHEGYWIKMYPVPEDTLEAKRKLIEALSRRRFNHTEPGLNIPGCRLDERRGAFQAETDPGRKRVKGAMYAGALFNRATDIFKRLVDLHSTGVEISPDNDLMRSAGAVSRSRFRSADSCSTAAAPRGSTSSGASRSAPSASRWRSSTRAAT